MRRRLFSRALVFMFLQGHLYVCATAHREAKRRTLLVGSSASTSGRCCLKLLSNELRSAHFFFKDIVTPEIFSLSLHDALPISSAITGPICLSWTTSIVGSLVAECKFWIGLKLSWNHEAALKTLDYAKEAFFEGLGLYVSPGTSLCLCHCSPRGEATDFACWIISLD